MHTLEQLKTGQLKQTKSLRLSDTLTEIPVELFELADSLELLDLSNSQLTELPDTFAQLQQLKIVFFNNNKFTHFPKVLARCPQLSMVSFKNNDIEHIAPQALSPNLRWLILTDNNLTQLPGSIGKLHRLQKLMLAGNQLQALPVELANCQNLELTRLSANQLQTLPEWLLSLSKLSWLAYAGNPFCRQDNSASKADVPIIETADIELQEILGSGASGIIYKGQWQVGNLGSGNSIANGSDIPKKTLAVKLFKGAITSDGRPEDEMQACMAAGTHPHLVSVLGQLSHPIDGKQGLVFSFIPDTYNNLGGPPSLESCTRDTYPAETTFTLPVALEIARGIASAANHLHQRGMMHGDLYAHNTLINDTGHSILGDFGAASFHHHPDAARTLEQLEVRAFGCLLDDLLRHCPPTQNPTEGTRLAKLQQLRQDCLHPVPSERPVFAAISNRLESL